jgi:alkaline phosphatase isozyme conversion protein
MKASAPADHYHGHLDTYAPQSDKDVENNLGGLTLQGIDDNAMGLA